MKISEKQKTDRTTYNTDKFFFMNKNASHSYDEYYDSLFERFENDSISLLEIGISYGGSLRLFSDYFKNGIIVGIDKEDIWNGKSASKYENLSLFYFNAYDKRNWNKLPDIKYDFIIDDGSHIYEHQLYFLKNYMELLKDDGVLILEDVREEDIEKFLNELNCDNNKVVVYNVKKITKRFDDIIIEVRK